MRSAHLLLREEQVHPQQVVGRVLGGDFDPVAHVGQAADHELGGVRLGVAVVPIPSLPRIARDGRQGVLPLQGTDRRPAAPLRGRSGGRGDGGGGGRGCRGCVGRVTYKVVGWDE